MKMLLAVVLLVAGAAVQAQDERVYTPGDEVSLPVVVTQVQPGYTSEAMRQMIEGEVVLDVVVTSSGNVGDVAVKQSLDKIYGLDESAVAAMKLWKFKPGTKDGKAVAVRVEVRMKFTLK